MIGADNSWIPFVNLPGAVDRVVHNIVPEPVFVDGTINRIVVNEVPSGRIDKRRVWLHSAETIVIHDGVVTGNVQGNGIARSEEFESFSKEYERVVLQRALKFDAILIS